MKTYDEGTQQVMYLKVVNSCARQLWHGKFLSRFRNLEYTAMLTSKIDSS